LSELHLATRCIHAGQAPDPHTGAVVAPIHQTTTYAQPSPGVYERYDYSRAGNPTRTALEDCLASLEGGPGSAAFSSGMAAISALIHMLPGGAHVVCGANVYGGTFRVFDKVYAPMGYRFSYIDTRDLDAVEAVLEDDVALMFLETPTNPLMHVTDIAAVAERARAKGAKVAVDNTFMSPVFQRPLELGADYVVHSGTKYLGGHSDVVIGFVVPRSTEDLEQLHFLQKSVGAIPAPMESWLCLRGLKTLAVRMRAHCDGARRVAQFLIWSASSWPAPPRRCASARPSSCSPWPRAWAPSRAWSRSRR
jgi:cystathionine beta-lyase/cystathionine gamma-synthase